MTDQGDAEARLREGSAQLARVERLAHLGSWDWDLETGVVQWSDELYRIHGHAPRAIVPTPALVVERTHPDDREALARLEQEALRGGKAFSHARRIVRPDGDVRILQVNAEVTCDAGGRPVRMSGTSQDVTERRRAEEEASLLQSVALAAGAAESLGAALSAVVRGVCRATGWAFGEAWIPGRDGSVLECTVALGSERDGRDPFRTASEKATFPKGIGLPGRAWKSKAPEWIRNASEDPTFTRRQAAVEAGIRTGFAVPILVGDEVVAVVAFYTRGELAEDSRLLKLVTSIAAQLGSVVRRKIAEEALRQRALLAELAADVGGALTREARLRDGLGRCAEALVKRIDAAFARIWTLNARENVLELQASAGLYTHLDGPHSRVPVGKFKIGLIAQERRAHLTNSVLEDPRVGDKEWARREGMVSFAGHPLVVGGELVGVMALFARRPLATFVTTALESVADTIAIAIKRDATERARTSLESQLRQSQKTEALGRLAGGIAHDFNNLLTAINGYGELLLGRLRAEDPVRPGLEQIRRAGLRAADLTRQLLAFSRKQVLAPRVIDVNVVISDMRDMLRRLIGEDVSLETVLAPALWRVNADPSQVEQLVLNLAVNARDAMPGGGKLVIETRNVDTRELLIERNVSGEAGPHVRITVRDTGCGMDQATLAKIFEPFFTTKELGRGTGLGLATVHGFVKQSQGHIYVDSEPGVGTTFEVYLPCVGDVLTPADPIPIRRGPPRGDETILVVEDEEIVRTLAGEFLRSCGYEVLEATGAEQALEICRSREGPIHLLLTDVVMPKVRGPELARRFVALRPRTRVLYVSGYTDGSPVVSADGALAAGLSLVEKPFTRETLARRVREVLDAASPPAR